MKLLKIKFFKTALVILIAVFASEKSLAQVKTYETNHFNKIIVSPHIAVNFVEGDSETVVVNSSTEPMEKLNVEVVGKTLRIYLDDAKMVTKQEKVKNDTWKGKKDIYKGTVIKATVTYKTLDELSLRGEEKFVCESPLNGKDFRLKLYGESQVYLNEVDLENLHTTIYGESYLELKAGSLNYQKITAYGETTINSLDVKTSKAKITAYGEGSYRLQVSERLKVTAFGEATIAYKGSPEVNKGIIIGEATIQKI
ncbi:head GIN domain-containing protein [uncultured Croceitalea sp.]|uniref:head GIN domain-containing protein n=1 Tax=uncultured Croceitalea sp. TaxID=1798908 RepID=UPI0033065550